MRYRFILPLALAAVAGSITTLATSPADAAEPYNINVILPLTGAGAFLGTGEKQSLELAEKAVNAIGGSTGSFCTLSSTTTSRVPQVGVQLATEVIASKPAVILGSSLVAICRAIAPLMKSGPVQYCFSPGLHPEPGAYSFTASVSTVDLAQAAVRYFRLKGWKRVALMVSTDATGQDFEDGMKQVLALPENKDMQVVATAYFNTTDISVTAQLENIKAADPQCFIAWSSGTPIQTIFRGAIQAGLDVPMATTDGNMTYTQMKQYADVLPEQLYIPSGEYIAHDPKLVQPAVAEAQDAFYAAFKAAGVRPDEPSELAWEPAMILVHALQTLGPQASAQQIHDFIVHLKGFPSIDGIYDFEKVPQRGLDVSNAVVTLWSKKTQTWDVVSEPGGTPVP